MKNIEQLKEKLEAEQKTLLGELTHIGVHDTETNEWSAVPGDTESEPDDNVRADKYEDFEERRTMTETFSGRLHDIETALKKIEAGTFGNCETCGGKIEEDRLEANPSARTCKEHMN